MRLTAQTLYWLGWKDLNPRITESESAALPLGDTPIFGLLFHSFYIISRFEMFVKPFLKKFLSGTKFSVLSYYI